MPRKIFTIPPADAAWLAKEAARLGLSEAGMVRMLIRLARMKRERDFDRLCRDVNRATEKQLP